MPKSQGLLQCLIRRETGCSLATDKNTLLAHVEDSTANSCTNEERCDLPGSPRSTFLVCFSPDRSKMASTHGDHTIRIVNSYTGKCLRTLQGHPRTPWCIAFHPSADELVASGCLGGEVRIWDLKGGCEMYTPPDRAVIASLAFHPTDKVLLIATSNKLFFWKWDQPQPFACLQTNFLEEKVRLVKFSPFGDYILTGITNVTQMENGNGSQTSNQPPINHLLQSVSCTQLDSDQVSQYILRQSNSQSQSSSNPSSQSEMLSSQPNQLSESYLSNQSAPNQSENSLSSVNQSQTASNLSLNQSETIVSNFLEPASTTQASSSLLNEEVDVMPPTEGRLPFHAQSHTRPRHRSEVLQQVLNTHRHVPRREETIPTTIAASGHEAATGSLTYPSRQSAMSRTRGSGDYRGVFAIFRARDGGSWNLDTSEVEGEPTDVGRTSLLFNQGGSASESMSFSQVDSTRDAANIMESGTDSGGTLTTTSQGGRLFTRTPGQRNVTLRNVTTSSELVPQQGLSSQPEESGSFDDLGRNTGGYSGGTAVYDISVQPESVQDTGTFTRITTNPMHEPALHASVSHHYDDGNSGRSTDVTVSMDSVGLGNEEGPGYNANGDRLLSGVGSVFNVGSVSSRTSYVSHGSNYSSSLSTLSNAEGSGTAIATATARTFRHVHTAVVIANGTNGGPQVALRTAINRAIAGAFAGSGEGAVASNIINTTHRLQWWDFSKVKMPDIKNANTNVLVPCCKIHNDASCDISADGTLLATFVPSAFGFPDDGMLGIYSLKRESLGQCLFTKKFGPNAISVSLSALNRHVVVGLAARRIHWHLTSRQMMAQIFKLEADRKAEQSDDTGRPPVLPPAVCNIVLHERDNERRSHVSVNAAFWHPVVGCGIVYGTNRGDLRLVRQRR